ncbi:hypothetical protein CLU79DRAFT_745574 [Phycomyces nitens]|nr:hypothetical protein CLU79DRAFT_745574 [Phycomyces nitens]
MPPPKRNLVLPSSMASPNRIFLSSIPISHQKPQGHSGMYSQPQEIRPFAVSKEFALRSDSYATNDSLGSQKENDPLEHSNTRSPRTATTLADPIDPSINTWSSSNSVASTEGSTIATSLSSQNSLLLCSSRGFRSPQPLVESVPHSNSTALSGQLPKPIHPTPDHRGPISSFTSNLPTALYYGSRQVRKYLRAVITPQSKSDFEDMLQHGFICSHTYTPNDDGCSVRTTTTHYYDALDSLSSQPCNRCGPDHRQMTLRITLTPWHCRATETEIYGQPSTARSPHGFSIVLNKSMSTASKLSSSWLSSTISQPRSDIGLSRQPSPVVTQSVPLVQRSDKIKKRTRRDDPKSQSVVPVQSHSTALASSSLFS